MYFYQTFSPPGIKKVVKTLFLLENMGYIYTGIDYQKEQRCIVRKRKNQKRNKHAFTLLH